MAQTGYTPILIYSSSTGGNAPAAGNLTNSTLGSELAINITDGKLFYKDNANAVQVIGWKTTPTTAGGTGLTSYTAGDLLYYVSGTALSKLGIGTNGQILKSTGSAPAWENVSALAVTSISFGTTGLTPSTATQGAVTVAGTLVAANGGTGQSSYTIGDILYASGTTTLAKLADVATGNALISGGVGVAPSWGKIGLTTHVSGTLPVGNGGTGTATAFTAGSVVFAGASGIYSQDNANLFWNNTNKFLGIGTAAPGYSMHIVRAGADASLAVQSSSSGAAIIRMFASTQGLAAFNSIQSLYGSTTSWSIGGNGVNDTIGFNTAGSQRVSIGSTGNLTIDNGNLVVATSGKGIDFSATPGTGTSELLDDYEEGTFTPTFTGLTLGNGTISGTYSKIGNIVTVEMAVNWGSTTSATAITGVTGLPFALMTAANNTYAVCNTSYLKQGVGWYFGGSTANYGSTALNNVIAGAGTALLSGTAPATFGNADYWAFSMTYMTTT